MKRLKVIICQGLPASGKSTWAKAFVTKSRENFIRVNRDELRRMRGVYWLPEQEELISKWELNIILLTLEAGYNVVIDDTNLNPKWLKILTDTLGSEVEIHWQDFRGVSLEECIKRDQHRQDPVGKAVIETMYYKYIEVVEPIIQNVSLQKAVICDLDGTLCLPNCRGPYEHEKCDKDLCNQIVYGVLCLFRDWGYKIIFVSGREEKFRSKTQSFFSTIDNWLVEAPLFMRINDDKRKDSKVKKEIFDKEIKNKYYVSLVLDDRNQVVSMWRRLGLTCWQVAEGAF